MLKVTYIKIYYTNFRSIYKGKCIPYTTYVILNFEAVIKKYFLDY